MSVGMDRDAHLELNISEDAMTCTGTFTPALGNGQLLTPDYLDAVLEAKNISFGMLSEEVAEVMFAVNTERRVREDVVVARGSSPVSARPAFFRVLHEAKPDRASFAHDSDRIDYKQQSRLPVVRKGQTIARRVPAREGKVGYNVRGDEIPYTTLPVDQVMPGKNTHVEDDRIVATIGGQMQTKDGQVVVEDELVIAGDVSYETGSIEFPGDVVLKGEVRDGFHIWAGGAITAANTVDVSEIYCRKDFTSAGGIRGRDRALLRCGGRVQSRFIGNCYVESKSSVFVKQYVYHSTVSTLDRFAMGNRGRVIGGILTAAEGVRCYTLGNAARAATTVRVGTNFIVERKLEACRDKYQAYTLKQQKLASQLTDDPTDRQVDILHRLEASRTELATQMGDLAGELDRYEHAEVIVDGDVHPGVHIQICRAVMVVEELMKRRRFYLDKNAGRVVAEPLAAGT
jgi:uncharacterized protein